MGRDEGRTGGWGEGKVGGKWGSEKEGSVEYGEMGTLGVSLRTVLPSITS